MKTPRTAIVLQARMSSVRLPGKVLAPIGAMSMLGQCLVRLQASRVAPVIVATTTRIEDDAVVEEAARYGVSAVRGPVGDVLARYLLVADRWNLEEMIRATADNPAVDIEAPGRVLAALRRRGADHVIDRGLPYGAAVEAIRVDALRDSAHLAREAADLEHVTQYLRRHHDSYRVVDIDAPAPLRRPDLRLSVDTAGDLAYMRQVFEYLPASPAPAPLAAIIAAADAVARNVEAA
jgi:spore coat polysaccharide biosynthesis protein SpsF